MLMFTVYFLRPDDCLGDDDLRLDDALEGERLGPGFGWAGLS